MEEKPEHKKIDYIDSKYDEPDHDTEAEHTDDQQITQLQNIPVSIERLHNVPMDAETDIVQVFSNFPTNINQTSTNAESFNKNFEQETKDDVLIQMSMFGTMVEPAVNFTFVPIKIYFITIILIIFGLAFFVIFIVFLGIKDYDLAIAFGMLSLIQILPAIFYVVMLCKMFRAKTPEDREEILNDIIF